MGLVDHIDIEIGSQCLYAFDSDGTRTCYRISTARNGVGEIMDSECTPRGRHRIDEMFGAGRH